MEELWSAGTERTKPELNGKCCTGKVGDRAGTELATGPPEQCCTGKYSMVRRNRAGTVGELWSGKSDAKPQ